MGDQLLDIQNKGIIVDNNSIDENTFRTCSLKDNRVY